ncbi:hypothetical protein N7468_006532 [Penicillium chermesinum]|uniref:Major facilitator superfamily (MFS) profile domain-containing protein n=1 Tax=Penicillium chermesinum TaxID=63820 RepID=A0A9W9NSE5_9EURO|nr:uncharacterized protein N7468_006532 [Penicillium chermesinum]KAJ5225307.1 hypothetical protein N7468_006532 [Penicillium chermesinum]
MGSSSPEHSGRPQANISEPSNDFNFRRSQEGEAQTHHASKPSHVAPTIVTSGINTPEVEHADAELRPDSSTPEKPVTWSSLPKKGQLAILTLARLSEPLTQTSLQAYLFYQLRSFDPSLPSATISAQAGVLQASFTAAQFLTAFWWGRLADTEWMGRKRVLLIGLFGTCISCLGFGFSRNFATAAVFRTLNGVLNSNVGVMRTMVSEIIVEKKYQSRAFLLLPMCFNIGVIIGPVLGGSLADPINSFPGIFGPGSWIGGENGVWWMKHWPFLLPQSLKCCVHSYTHEIARYRQDWGRDVGKRIARSFTRRPQHYHSLTVAGEEGLFVDERVEINSAPASPTGSPRPLPRPRQRPPFSQIFTRNVLLTLFAHFLLAAHTSAFNALTFVFLPTPRAPEGSRTDFFHFGGGLGLPSARVGLATAIIGFIGLPLQIFVYPRVQGKLGTLTSFRFFLPFSPLAYILMPFLVVLPRAAAIVWPSFSLVVGLQVLSRTFALPAAIILVNNSVTDSSILGTVHGVAQRVSSAARTLGPLLGGWGLGLGLSHNIVGAVWWALAAEALLGYVVLWTIREGKGVEPQKFDVEELEEELDR